MQLYTIQQKIHEIRNEKVMLDFDLAELYGVATKVLKQAVRRNISRFPEDFMFVLSEAEFLVLRSQSVTSKRGGMRYLPFAFTEQGVAMLSSVLNSPKAIDVNIRIIRTFVLMRQCVLSHTEISEKLKELEIKQDDICEVMNYLLRKDQLHQQQVKRKPIGFTSEKAEKG
ncbi:ORF6N domain-containing protein [Crocinitomicaceae bacterium CZZ-1]|uniref:ORF6N domain-containing protein n=1 Tax=Taishania pollutisoli TaxID=2766479 RepID=A0A8J6P457_9FLAO|nr:ORF6N domain-containing protein [Taishania pollutisoli]MBC9811164.1 ORF6N domain-containing protein [Taishania pollutisoli]